MWFGRFCGRIVALILILIAGIFVAINFYSAQLIVTFKPKIESELSKIIKQNVQIDGIRARLLPRLGFELSGVRIAEDIGCKQGIRVGTVMLSLDLESLFSKKIEIDKLEVGSLQVELFKSDAGISLSSPDQSACSVESWQSKNATLQQNTAPKASTAASDILEVNLEKIIFLNSNVIINRQGLPALKFESINFESGIQVRDPLIVLNSSQLAFKYQGQKLSYSSPLISVDTLASSFELGAGELTLQQSKINLQATVSPGLKLTQLSLKASSINLALFMRALSTLLQQKLEYVKDGIADLSIKLERKDDQTLLVKGNLFFKSLTLPILSITAKELKLDNAELQIVSSELTSFSSNVSSKDFSLVDGKNKYFAQSIVGPLKYTKDRASRNISGDLSVTAFAYENEATKVTQVTANLKKVSVKISKDGFVDASTSLQDGSALLSTPDIEVTKIKKVNSPVSVIVKPGYYEVKGPVRFEEGSFKTLGRKFEGVSGNVAVFISDNRKQFDASAVSGTTTGQKFMTTTTFKMLPDSYQVLNAILQVAGGKVNLTAKVDRNEQMSFTSQINASSLDFGTVLAIAGDNAKVEVFGNMDLSPTVLSGTIKNLLPSLQGSGSLVHTQNADKGFHLTQKIAGAIASIPLVGVSLVPSSLTDVSNVQTSKADFSIKNQIVNFTKVFIQRDNYEVLGKGSLDFSGNVNGKIAVNFLQKTMEMFGGGFTALSQMLGRLGRVSIPLFISGKVPNISFSPDLATLARDNSGLTLIGSTLTSIGDVGLGIADFVTSPFSRNKTKNKNTATP